MLLLPSTVCGEWTLPVEGGGGGQPGGDAGGGDYRRPERGRSQQRQGTYPLSGLYTEAAATRLLVQQQHFPSQEEHVSYCQIRLPTMGRGYECVPYQGLVVNCTRFVFVGYSTVGMWAGLTKKYGNLSSPPSDEEDNRGES